MAANECFKERSDINLKCVVCGYEYDTNNLVDFHTKKPFIIVDINMDTENNKYHDHYFTIEGKYGEDIRVHLFACPKCSTIRMEG